MLARGLPDPVPSARCMCCRGLLRAAGDRPFLFRWISLADLRSRVESPCSVTTSSAQPRSGSRPSAWWCAVVVCNHHVRLTVDAVLPVRNPPSRRHPQRGLATTARLNGSGSRDPPRPMLLPDAVLRTVTGIISAAQVSSDTVYALTGAALEAGPDLLAHRSTPLVVAGGVGRCR